MMNGSHGTWLVPSAHGRDPCCTKRLGFTYQLETPSFWLQIWKWNPPCSIRKVTQLKERQIKVNICSHVVFSALYLICKNLIRLTYLVEREIQLFIVFVCI